MDRYLAHLLSAVAVLILAAVTVNWLADPYAVFNTPVIKGFNEAKPAMINNSRIFKIAGFSHQKMDALILGTSRTDVGINPKHGGFRNQYAYNMALPGQPNTESALIFKFIADRNPLKTVVMGLDFFASNALLTYTDDFTPDNFENDRRWKLLLSSDTLLASKKTFFKSGDPVVKPDTARLNFSKKYSKQAFLESEKGYMWGGSYLPSPKCQYRFEAERMENGRKYLNQPLEAIRSMMKLAHQRGIHLYLFISPSHARQWETLAAVGLWNQWEEWKRRLVRINAEEAASAQRLPFPLWDFSGYHSLSTEALPTANDKKAEMFGYIESSHYKPVIGNMLLDRMFGLNTSDKAPPEDFGMLLTENTIDGHLLQIRLARQQYRQSHVRDIEEIEALSRETMQERKCHDDKWTF